MRRMRAAAEDRVSRAKIQLIKRKAMLSNLEKKYNSAKRNGNYDGKCLTAVKEEVIGTLVHRQKSRVVRLKAKVTFDGRQILRVLNKQKKSDQLAAHVRILNGGELTHLTLTLTLTLTL